MVRPADFVRRSFVYRELEDAGARFAELGGAAVAADFGDPTGESKAAQTLGLVDLSPLPRTGFRGRAALAWLRGNGVGKLTRDNVAVAQEGGTLAARLAPGEALILGDLKGQSDLCDRLDAALADMPDPACHRVPRRDGSFHFLLTGARADQTMAKLCGVDLRARHFPAGQVAQTSVARMSMIVIAGALGDVRCFHLLGDSASAGYAWSVLLDAMAEFDGRPVGLDTVGALSG